MDIKDLETLLDKLKDGASRKSFEEGGIADCSLRIEYQKFKIANLLKSVTDGRCKILCLVNCARLFESNIYSFMLQCLEDKKDPKESIKEIKEFCENSYPQLIELAEDCK